MDTKKNKYDTNPLDPEAERKAAESWGDRPQTQNVHRGTRDVANEYSEAPTRRIDPQSPEYPSVFVPPTYAPPAQVNRQNIYAPPVNSADHSVQGLGVPERWAVAAAYAPFYIGLVVSLVELFLVPRREGRVRFHASQALAVHIAILIIHSVFGVIGSIAHSSFGGVLFSALALAFLVISMIRVWRGESHQIPPVAEPAKWFNEHIEPRNQS